MVIPADSYYCTLFNFNPVEYGVPCVVDCTSHVLMIVAHHDDLNC